MYRTRKGRNEFEVMLDFAREGEQLITTRPDRLPGSLLGLQNTSKTLENKKIDLLVIEQHIDIYTVSGRLLFNIVGVVAEFERELINESTAEEKKTAKKRGVKFCTKRKPTKRDAESIRSLIAMGESKFELAKRYNIGRSTLYRILKELESEEADTSEVKANQTRKENPPIATTGHST